MKSIIKKLIIIEKVIGVIECNNYIFEVDCGVNKFEIKDVVEKMFSVKVIDVWIMIYGGGKFFIKYMNRGIVE